MTGQELRNKLIYYLDSEIMFSIDNKRYRIKSDDLRKWISVIGKTSARSILDKQLDVVIELDLVANNG